MSTGGFTTIVVTSPLEISGESDRICRLLSSGAADFVHLRKPFSDAEEMERLILQIDESFHGRLILHDSFSLLDKFCLAGVQVNSRNPHAPVSARMVTKSCHSIAEIIDAAGFDYVTLSPVFDSISKKGYASRFANLDIAGKSGGNRVIAMGGVTPDRFLHLCEMGFNGAAMLGYVWDTDSHREFENRVDEIIKQKKICCNL